jgi:cytochrome c oxidase assembly factor CtaG/cytochrome c2
MRALTLGILLLWGTASAASAHGVDFPDGSPWLAWSLEPWAVLCLADAWIWYGLGVWRLAHEVGLRRALSRARILAFAAGMSVLVIALLSPVDTLGDSLFWMHMVQHLLLTLVAPPLLVWSRPSVVFVWAFPRSARKRVARVWNGVGLSRTVQALLNPLVVWLLFTGVFLVWHLPGPFQLALDYEIVHDAEHLSFFVTGLMFWSVVIAPSSRHKLGYGGRLLFLTTNGVLTGFPGALMVLAPRVLYPIQALRSAEWGLTGLEDQQLAGSIMWVVGGFVYLAAGSWLFVRWLDAADKPNARRAARIASYVPILLLPLLLASCNETREPQRQLAGLMQLQGDARRGVKIIRNIGCGNCHTIPGVAGADGVVGPPLTGIGRRVFLAGVLRNTPPNMVLWLRSPQKVIPGNAMPDSGLSEKDARDVATYLASLD